MSDFDSMDFAARRRRLSRRSETLLWPVNPAAIKRLGDNVTIDRNGSGRPHKGLDIFVPAGTLVVSAISGTVIRVVDGRLSRLPGPMRAGLWVDLLGKDRRIYRYLHLGSAAVHDSQKLSRGDQIGVVAAAHTSGLASDPHLHFEIRLEDYLRARRDYGQALDPKRLLPPERA